MDKEELLKEIMKLPKVETNNAISSMDGINVDDLMNIVDRLNKIPDYNDLLKENKQLKDTIYKTQVLIRRLKTTEWRMYGYDLLDLIQNILDEKDISNELLEIEMLRGELK